MARFRSLGWVALMLAAAFVAQGVGERAAMVRPPIAEAQTLPSLTGIAALVPSGATAVQLDAFTLDGNPYASLSYSDAAFPPNQTFVVYSWDGQSWNSAFDLSITAAGICQTELQDLGPSFTCGWSVGEVNTLVKLPFEQSPMPDLLAVSLGFIFPPGNHYVSALVLIGNSSRGMAAVQTLEFRGAAVDSTLRQGASVIVEANAFGQGDPLCCPRSFQYVVLSWIGNGFVETARCVQPRRAFSSSPCS